MKNNKENGIYRFYDFKKDEKIKLSYDETTPWASALLKELEEHSKINDFKELEESNLKFEGEIYKGTGGKYGEHLVLTGKLELSYRTYCVNGGTPLLAPVKIDINIFCIDEENKEKFEMEDELIIYVNDIEFELFFYDGSEINVGDLIREIVFIEKEDYPVLPQ